ncbi:DUF4382 domain-containing protein [Candidatus Bathyarchaeota archaeon]|nr:DUF4382 domain-containing protein [Candidatus Bathyarchaeota archaeon]
MAYETRKLVMGAAGGFLIAALIISGFLWSGMLPITEAKGMLIIEVKDDPAELNELWLNISTVRVHREGEGNETWKEIPVIATEPFDLLRLRNVSTVLAAGELPVGDYTEIRFQIFNAWANTTENQNQTLNVVANGWVMVKVHFTIEEVPVTSVLVDIEVNEDPILNASTLMPVAKATVDYIEY